MVQNREELLAAVQGWMQQAASDLRGHIENFMSTQDVTLEELSDVLAIPLEEMQAMANGNANISLESFAKLLIANGFAIQIMPVMNSPIGSYRGPQHGTNRGGFNPIPTDQFGRPLPPPPGFMGNPMGRPMTPMGRRPMMQGQQGRPMGQDPFNGGMPHAERPIAPQGGQQMPVGRIVRPQGGSRDPYGRLSLDALKDIIVRNNWNYEIDLNTASRETMIQFLKDKEQIRINGGAPRASHVTPTAAQQQGQVQETNTQAEEPAPQGSAEDKTSKLIAAMTNFFKSNPEAAATIYDSMGQ